MTMDAPAAAASTARLKKNTKKNRCKCRIARLLCRNDPINVAKLTVRRPLAEAPGAIFD
jgi:hypothetical protein